MRSRIVVLLVAAAVAAGLIVTTSGLFGSDDSSPSELTVDAGASAPSLIAGHVHGIARHPDSGEIYVATHEGMYVLTGSGVSQKVGPVIDLMGFTIGGKGQLLASGHHGVGTDLPQPVGLIESADGGKSWTVRSRGGQSDFHALTESTSGVVGYDGDGTLRTSSDGRTWSTLPPLQGVTSLGASPGGARMLAATSAGLFSSNAPGNAWAPIPDAPALLLLDWADEARVVGLGRDGSIYVSSDAGGTWKPSAAKAMGPPQAIEASIVQGRLEILAVTHKDVVISSDGGASFNPLG